MTFALFSRYMRASAIENLAQDYIRTARAAGLGPVAIMVPAPAAQLGSSRWSRWWGAASARHPDIRADRGAALQLSGIGLAYFNAATNGDYPVVFGVTVLVAAGTVAGNLIADIGYAILDPRVRWG